MLFHLQLDEYHRLSAFSVHTHFPASSACPFSAQNCRLALLSGADCFQSTTPCNGREQTLSTWHPNDYLVASCAIKTTRVRQCSSPMLQACSVHEIRFCRGSFSLPFQTNMSTVQLTFPKLRTSSSREVLEATYPPGFPPIRCLAVGSVTGSQEEGVWSCVCEAFRIPVGKALLDYI